MKRRYLVFLFTMFFMFLYIGPVNLLPSSIPPAIVQRPQEANPTLEKLDNFVVATDYDVVIAADEDDDYWLNDVHYAADVQQKIIGYYPDYPGYGTGGKRFVLDIPAGATIVSANMSVKEYTNGDPSVAEIAVYRFDEDDIGPLESDVSLPTVDWSVSNNVTTDGSVGWETFSITDIVQAGIDEAYWDSGDYMGFHIYKDLGGSGYWRWEDYQSDSESAYLNISYSYVVYGENWLVGWNRRKQHTILQTAGTGANYTVPMWVYESDGSDSGDTVYLNFTSQEDFDDIRWTNGSGDVLLDFNLNLTESASEDYYTNDSLRISHYPGNYPAAWYYNDRTYVVINGPNGEDTRAGDPYIRYYDHENSTWSDIVKVGDNPLVEDDHGAPCLFINNTGHIHIFYGSHNSPVEHAVSTNPEDITSWTQLDDVFDGTYPHISYDSDNNVAHVYMRGDDAGTDYLTYYNSSDGGVTWSSPQHILDLNDEIYPYMEGAGGIDPYDSQLMHIGWSEYNQTLGTVQQDIFYLYLNVTTGTVYNVTGHSQGTSLTTRTELDNCKVYDSSGKLTWGPSVHVDSDSTPYLIWGQNTAPTSEEVTKFSYWDGDVWTVAEDISEPSKASGPHDFIVHSSTDITAFIGDDDDISRYTWDGDTWTQEEIIYNAVAQALVFSMVPHGTPGGIGHYNDTIQVIFCEWFGGDEAWAWGTSGIVGSFYLNKAKFYVTIPTNLSESNAVIYIYYDRGVAGSASQQLDYTTGNDPDHGAWGAEETAGYFYPVNYQAPTLDNPDDTDNMYARYKEYNITMYVSDQNGYADIDYLKLGFWDDGRSNNYARWRYDSPEDTFVEEYDWDDYFELNLTKSEATKSGDYINCTFVFTVDWSCPDLTDVHMAVTVFDNISLYDVDDFHFLTWDVETRLDFTIGPTLNDGSGTVDRGDYDTLDGIIANGTVDYYGSAISPDSAEVDVWVSCSDVEGGPWSDTTLTAGVFSVTVDSDNVVGLDTYSFIVVEKGEGVGGSDLSHASHSDTYIADRLIVDIQADDRTPFNEQQVNFTLTVIYDYDDTVCSAYTIVVSRNTVWWHTFINGNKTLFNDTNSDVWYVYTTYDISESTHGLTEYSSGSESVTWSGEATTPPITTTPITTETGIFYDLFLSLDMWGYLGPLGLVVIGYVLAKKDRGLGVIAFMVQCLFVAQYLVLVSATPDYWWHVFIILFGGIFSCVVPLMDKR